MGAGRIDLTDFRGLVTAPGLFERAPASAVDGLMNWEFPAPGVVRKRRGFERMTANAGGPVWQIFSSQLLNTNILAHVGTTTQATQFRYGDGTGAGLTAISAVASSTLTRPASLRSKMALCQRNHYLTATEGVARLESALSLVRFAGMPRGLGLHALSVVAGTANPLADGFARGYRITWHRKDDDGVELGGAPTGRTVVSNRSFTSGYAAATARAASVRSWLPREWGTMSLALTTQYYWRLWATSTFDEANGQFGNDEMYLVAEAYVTAADITNGYVAYVDDTPDTFLVGQPTLHTNQYNFPDSEAGLLQGVANEDAPPPPSNDVAYWNDVMWYADITPRASCVFGLVANLANNDTVTISSGGGFITYTGKTGALVAPTDFSIMTTAPTTALNIRGTVANLVAAINSNASGNNATLGACAYHVSTTGTAPGIILLESRRQGFVVDAWPSAPAKFQGYDGYSPGEGVSESNARNVLVFSKPVRADAVPPVNRLTVGPTDATLLRVFPLRDRLLCFTTHGIYQVVGRTYADFAVMPFDLGYRLMGRDLVALCDQKVYAWTHEGIIEIDDGGVTVISAPIEPSLTQILVDCGQASGDSLTPLYTGQQGLAQQGFATAYRSRHQVRFFAPQVNLPGSNVGCAFWYGWDTRTRTWTFGQFGINSIDGYLDGRTCGVVRFSDDLLFHGCWSTGADTYLFKERGQYGPNDYYDDQRDGSTGGVYSVLPLQFLVPDSAGAQHWQQTVINWEEGVTEWTTRPSSVTFSYVDEAGSTVNTIITPAAPATRVEVPANRRAQRLRLTLTHEQREYCGIVGISQHYRSGSRFARRTVE